MLLGARQFFERRGGGVPYIMPDGSSYWDTGFKGGSGCEYLFDCMWLDFPRNPQNIEPERVLMGTTVYTGIVACSFNWFATSSDTLTTQATRTETRCQFNADDWVMKRSIIRVRHRVGDNYLRIGFVGGTESSVYKGSLSAQSNSMYLCAHRIGSYDDGTVGPMTSNIVMIFNVQIKQNGMLAKNFIPALDGNIPCFYEEVSGTFVHSIGTTNGVYGLYRD